MDTRANQAHAKNQGPHWAGLGRVSGGVAFSYARARQRLALLFARLLFTTATKLRAAGAVALAKMAVAKIMCRLKQKTGGGASNDSV